MARTLLVVVFLIGLAFSAPTSISNSSQVFSQAKHYYQIGQYDSTIAIVHRYLKKRNKDQATEYIVPLCMEAVVRRGKYSVFDRLYGTYFRRFPRSPFIPRLYYLNGVVRGKKKEHKKSLVSFSKALQLGVSKDLDSLVLLNVETLCKRDLTHGTLNRFSRISGLHPKIGEVLLYYEVKKLHELGQIAKAKSRADKYKKLYSKSLYHTKVKEVFAEDKGLFKKSIDIGLLAPLSGYNADLGKSVVQGVKLAIADYNAHNTPKIDLVIADTRGSMVETAKKTRELIKDYKVSVILGPVLSPNATVAASILMENPDVIMISPTATDDGIAGLGKNVFQLNVTLGILGMRIARYAIETLGITEFALITPMSEYGRILSTQFKDEVKRLGGEILADEYYDEGTHDFKSQFESLRKKLAERHWELLALDGILGIDETPKDKRMKESYLKDSTIAIGGLFVPGESSDAIKIASQVYFHRIRTQLLGSNGWHNSATILDGKRYVNNAIFSTNFEVDVQDPNWIRFSRQYETQYKEKPDHIVAPLGYDAARLVVSLLQSSKGFRPFVEGLRKTEQFNGISGTISLNNSDGVNSEAAIMKISNKKFIKVQ